MIGKGKTLTVAYFATLLCLGERNDGISQTLRWVSTPWMMMATRPRRSGSGTLAHLPQTGVRPLGRRNYYCKSNCYK